MIFQLIQFILKLNPISACIRAPFRQALEDFKRCFQLIISETTKGNSVTLYLGTENSV